MRQIKESYGDENRGERSREEKKECRDIQDTKETQRKQGNSVKFPGVGPIVTEGAPIGTGGPIGNLWGYYRCFVGARVFAGSVRVWGQQQGQLLLAGDQYPHYDPPPLPPNAAVCPWACVVL